MKKRNGFGIAEILLVTIIIASLSVFLFVSGSTSKSMAADIKKDQILSVDRALTMHYQQFSHKYPDSLEDLRTKELIPKKFSVNGLTYQVRNEYKEYRLSVVLENGSTYVSPYSYY